MLPFLFAYVPFFFLDVFRAHKNVVFFLFAFYKKGFKLPNNLIYITTTILACLKSVRQSSKKISNVKYLTQNQL